jgi:hypothetical protein
VRRRRDAHREQGTQRASTTGARRIGVDANGVMKGGEAARRETITPCAPTSQRGPS